MVLAAGLLLGHDVIAQPPAQAQAASALPAAHAPSRPSASAGSNLLMDGPAHMPVPATRGAASAAPASASTSIGAGARTAARAAPGISPQLTHPIFVLNSLDASISIIDPATLTEVRRIPTGKEPHHLYLSPDEKSLIVANALGDTLTFLDPATGAVQRVLPGVGDPYHLRFSPDMKWFVTAANRLDFLAIYRYEPSNPSAPLQLAARVPAARTPSHLNIDSRSTVVYATMQDSDELLAVDLQTQKPRWKISVGKLPADLYLTADDKLLFVGLTGEEYVEVYDVSGPLPRLVTRIKTGMGAHAFRARGDKRHIFVSNRVANTISMIDTQTMTVVANYPAPGGPDCMDISADGKTLLVTSRWARKLTLIDTERKVVVRQVSVGRSPHGVWTLDHAPRL